MRNRAIFCSQLSEWNRFRLGFLRLFLCSCLILAGCDSWYLGYSSCAYYDRPRIENRELRHPILNQVFSESVFVDIDNAWSDDSYFYRIAVQGTLPPGVSYSILNQTVRFEGTAIDLGTYHFAVEVDVRYRYDDNGYYYSSGYCSYNDSRNFELVVAQG